MKTHEQNWSKIVSRLLKLELSKQRIKYAELKSKLERIGITETENSISLKITRGTFSAAFMLQILYVIGTEKLQMSLVKSLLEQADEIDSDII